ncbi:MAG: hypothetical protein HY744_13420 [Deltaproteobacteria bacterium]|nr:hypothetical protein [Deltaproteobacteria bacterium]
MPASRRAGFLDLLVHFHGAEAVRALLAPADLGLVIVAIDAGEGSQRYAEAFAAPSALGELVESVRRALAEQDGAAPRLGRLVVSAWSAGYGAVHQILLRRPEGLDAVILLDGLHASYGPDGGLGVEAIEPFLDFARRARDGKAMMVVTHSEIRPVGYASTSETASYLLHELGAQRRYAGLVALEGVEQKTSFAQGGLRVRGYTGTTREAHCALLRMLPPILRDDVLPGLRQRTKNSQTPKPDSW